MPDSIAEIVLDLLKVLERYLNVDYRNRDFNASLATYLATLSSHHLTGRGRGGRRKSSALKGFWFADSVLREGFFVKKIQILVVLGLFSRE